VGDWRTLYFYQYSYNSFYDNGKYEGAYESSAGTLEHVRIRYGGSTCTLGSCVNKVLHVKDSHLTLTDSVLEHSYTQSDDFLLYIEGDQSSLSTIERNIFRNAGTYRACA